MASLMAAKSTIAGTPLEEEREREREKERERERNNIIYTRLFLREVLK